MVAEFRMGDVVRLRKKHPCGSDQWRVIRLGADIGIRCLACDRRVLLPRRKFEKSVKEFIERGKEPGIHPLTGRENSP
ncbi:MAG: DUF951 domain-containing protein [Anaerolineae bacterium]